MTWDEYAEKMRPWIRRLIGPRIRPHPFLGRDDLMQEGLMALWQTWQKHHEALPDEELCRLGTTVMRRRMADAAVASGQRGEKHATMFPISPSLGVAPRHGRVLADPGAAVDACLLARAMADLDAELMGTTAQRILREVFAPSERTVEAVRQLWGTSSQRSWAVVRSMALAIGLDCPIEDVRDAWRVIEARVEELLTGEVTPSSASVRYTQGDGPTQTLSEGNMDATNDTVVDTDLMPPGMEPAAKETKVKKGKEKPAKGPKANTKEKTAKGVFDHRRTVPIGTGIKCKQGTGEVTDIFYRVRLKSGKMCNVSAKTAEKA